MLHPSPVRPARRVHLRPLPAKYNNNYTKEGLQSARSVWNVDCSERYDKKMNHCDKKIEKSCQTMSKSCQTMSKSCQTMS